jgi:Tol biopolymer transport system component
MPLRIAALPEEVLGMRKTALPLATMITALLASALILATTVNPARAAFPGKNGKITFLSDRDGNNEIYTISFRNGEWGNAKRLTSSAKSDKTPSFSPNGKKIAWERGDNLYKMDANGTNQRKIPNTTHFNFEIGRYGSYGGNPAFSPGARKIIFDKGKNIWTINPDGSNPTRITNALAGDSSAAKPTFVHPVWSPVNNKIAFSWLYRGAREIHVMALSELQGEKILDASSRITPAGIGVYRPDWSPDGKKIVYECSEAPCESGTNHSHNPNIYRVNPDGSNNIPIVTSSADDSYPVFSPSGGKIVFSSDRDGDEDLYIKNADGSGTVQQITHNRSRDVEPDWQPVR